jgi:type II secretory pathway component PulF
MTMPFFSPRVRTKDLVGLCRRMGTSLEAGIDARTAWGREINRATGPLRRHVSTISQAVNHGETLTEAFAETGDFFPAILREMVQVGEQTGHLDSIFTQMADQYEVRLAMRRSFLRVVAWPMLELILVISFIGLVIWITDWLRNVTGNPKLGIFGLGLVGTRGLLVYLTFWAAVIAGVWAVVRAAGRGLIWTRPLQRLILRIPAVGRPLQIIALERLAWSLSLTMNTGMDVRRALALSLRGTQNALCIDHIPTIDAEIVAGSSIYEAFCEAGGYPADFLDTLAVGEQSGKLGDSMEILARQYRERARMALGALAVLAGVAVGVMIAAFIVVLIFRVFVTAYLGPINDALKQMR